jgi:hypothetical protein
VADAEEFELEGLIVSDDDDNNGDAAERGGRGR